MKNTLLDLNNHLFEQLERLTDDELTDEQIEREIKKTDAVVKIADKIIESGQLAFRTMQHMDEYGYGNANRSVPTMLTYDKKQELKS